MVRFQSQPEAGWYLLSAGLSLGIGAGAAIVVTDPGLPLWVAAAKWVAITGMLPIPVSILGMIVDQLIPPGGDRSWGPAVLIGSFGLQALACGCAASLLVAWYKRD